MIEREREKERERERSKYKMQYNFMHREQPLFWVTTPSNTSVYRKFWISKSTKIAMDYFNVQSSYNDIVMTKIWKA